MSLCPDVPCYKNTVILDQGPPHDLILTRPCSVLVSNVNFLAWCGEGNETRGKQVQGGETRALTGPGLVLGRGGWPSGTWWELAASVWTDE